MWKKLLRQTKGKLIPVKVKETEKINQTQIQSDVWQK